MEIGIDSFAAAPLSNENDRTLDNSIALAELLERIEFADRPKRCPGNWKSPGSSRKDTSAQ